MFAEQISPGARMALVVVADALLGIVDGFVEVDLGSVEDWR